MTSSRIKSGTMNDKFDEFHLSKKVKKKLRDREQLKKELAAGKSAQEILEFSNSTMEKFASAAYGLLESGHHSDAANAFLFLVTLNLYQYDYWLGFGMASQLCGEYAAAIDAYEMAASCKLENPFPYFYLAKCLFAIHERESALMAINLALEYADEHDEYSDLKKQALAAKRLLKSSK